MKSNSQYQSDKAPEKGIGIESPFRRVTSDFLKSKIAMGALFIFTCIVLVAIFASWISPQNPYDLAEIDIRYGRLPPGSKDMSGMTFWLYSSRLGLIDVMSIQ